jgi:PhnB protein
MTSSRLAAIFAFLLSGLASACASGGKVPEKQPKETITSKDIDRGSSGEPIEKTFWAERFGMVVDRFGVPWMINCETAA